MSSVKVERKPTEKANIAAFSPKRVTFLARPAIIPYTRRPRNLPMRVGTPIPCRTIPTAESPILEFAVSWKRKFVATIVALTWGMSFRIEAKMANANESTASASCIIAKQMHHCPNSSRVRNHWASFPIRD